MVKQDPKQTVEYLLGQIANDVATIKERQTSIYEDVEELKKSSAYVKGVVAAIGFVGGIAGGIVKSLLT